MSNIENMEKVYEELIKLKEYEKIIKILESKEQKGFTLSDLEYDILKLVKVLVNMIKTNEIPKKTTNGANKLRHAINGAEYERALELCLQSKDSVKLPDNRNAIYLLLLEINQLIEKINKTKIEQENEKTEEPKLPIAHQLITYAIKELLNNNLDNAFRALYSYLALIDKNEYEFLIVNLIKLDLIKNDCRFNELISTLNALINNEFYFDEQLYIKFLYESLSNNKMDEAQIYLDIVSKRNEQLKDLEFKDKEEKYKYYRQTAISRISVACQTLGLNYSKFADGVKKNGIVFDRFKFGNLVVTNPKKFMEFVKVANGELVNQDEKVSNVYFDTSFIGTKINELKQGRGFVILGKMNDEKTRHVKEVVGKIPDVAYFIVGTGDIKTVALKHRTPLKVSRTEFKPLFEEARIAYDEQDYERCISLQKKILALGKPNSYIFAQIGLSYLKLFKHKTAIKYLSMATQLSMLGNGNYDFTDLIERLSGKANRNDQKNFLTKEIQMKEQDFIQDNNYGITNYEEIKALVSHGMSINDACMQFNLNEEQRNIVKLIFARECYAMEDYVTGDLIIKHVERSKNKTPFVLQLIDELRRDKKFYKNRIINGTIFVKKISI